MYIPRNFSILTSALRYKMYIIILNIDPAIKAQIFRLPKKARLYHCTLENILNIKTYIFKVSK